MVGHRIAYGLWLLGWLLVWALSKSAMPGCILAGSLGAAALEIALTALDDRCLRVSLCAQLSAQKGETVEALLTVENGSVLTCAAVCLRVGCRNLLTGEQGERRLRFSVAGKQKRSAAAAFSAQRCGKLEFSLRDLRVYDLFGLYGRKISCDARAYSLVLPELYPVQLSFSDRSSVELDSDEYSMHHPGDDPSETFALREYVPGDRVRSIHWKLTEKTGEVIVRQLGLPVNHSILLLMDNSVSAPCAPEDCEALGELTASVSAALCSAGFAHQIAWFDRAAGCADRSGRNDHGAALAYNARPLELCPCRPAHAAAGAAGCAGSGRRRGDRAARRTARSGGRRVPCTVMICFPACAPALPRRCLPRHSSG